MKSKIGPLMVVGFQGKEAPEPLLQRIREGRVGGVILFARNIESPAQVAGLNRALREAAPEDKPLLVGVDQEGGRVQRLREPLTRWPPMARLGHLDDIALTEEVGAALGGDLAALGFNLDFAPVLDVVSEPENTVIGDRSFGADPALVARHGMALARGLLSSGVLPCGKHFPGHGGPVADSHVSLPRELRSEAQLSEVDWVPFKHAMEQDLPMLMTAHVLFDALDRHSPGTLSRPICTGLLRERMGFKGVLISDDLDMAAISGSAPPGEAALTALMSGVDLLLMCEGHEQQLEALEYIDQDAENNDEVRVRIQEAEARVTGLRRLIMSPPLMDPEQAAQGLLREGHQDLLARIS